MTIAAACRYALTGVGAAIAAGSQKCSGMSADLLAAPTRRQTIAAVTAPPVGGAAMISDMRNVPPWTPRITTPTSMARPPAVVRMIACMAARRLALRSA
ncbi:Uncharacterised protein [Mycobacteroides abscessus]|nr:Uncharacterised protein [Mycobacteroides abscessus]